MNKRKGRKGTLDRWSKRARVSSIESDFAETQNDESVQQQTNWLIKPEDMIENKVDIIIKDAQNNCRRSLTISGTGLGVEKTIAVVEAIKRNYLKQGTRYSQETSIKASEDNQAHLQVVLTLLDLKAEANQNVDATEQA